MKVARDICVLMCQFFILGADITWNLGDRFCYCVSEKQQFLCRFLLTCNFMEDVIRCIFLILKPHALVPSDENKTVTNRTKTSGLRTNTETKTVNYRLQDRQDNKLINLQNQ